MGTIQVKGVGKAYRRYRSKWSRALELATLGRFRRHESSWVLKDVSFDVRPGESVGIVGQNGAGKSTLLKIITGTVAPTEGDVQIDGSVAALLELGMGFHPDFTGRENAFMSGQLLGFGVEAMTAKMPEIEAFAEIGDYMDQPIRTYSSGMTVRLAFSVATAVRPDILIVDEALAVGDVFFQQKCFERIRQFVAQGTTLLFVSHAGSLILELCDRAVLLDHGRLKLDGSPKDVIDLYVAQMVKRGDNRTDDIAVVESDARQRRESLSSAEAPPPSAESLGGVDQIGALRSESVTLQAVEVLNARGGATSSFVSGETARIRISYSVRRDLVEPHVGFKLRNPLGVVLYETNSYCMGLKLAPVRAGETLTVEFAIDLRLAGGDYTISASMANIGSMGTFKEALHMEHERVAIKVVADLRGVIWSGLVDVSPRFQVIDGVPSALKSAA